MEKGNLALRDRYFAFLKAGGSEDPYVLLKRVGFDALDSSAWEEVNWKSTRKNAPNLTHEEEESNDRN